MSKMVVLVTRNGAFDSSPGIRGSSRAGSSWRAWARA
jgi:hypothetical protein